MNQSSSDSSPTTPQPPPSTLDVGHYSFAVTPVHKRINVFEFHIEASYSERDYQDYQIFVDANDTQDFIKTLLEVEAVLRIGQHTDLYDIFWANDQNTPSNWDWLEDYPLNHARGVHYVMEHYTLYHYDSKGEKTELTPNEHVRSVIRDISKLDPDHNDSYAQQCQTIIERELLVFDLLTRKKLDPSDTFSHKTHKI